MLLVMSVLKGFFWIMMMVCVDLVLIMVVGHVTLREELVLLVFKMDFTQILIVAGVGCVVK